MSSCYTSNLYVWWVVGGEDTAQFPQVCAIQKYAVGATNHQIDLEINKCINEKCSSPAFAHMCYS